MNVLAQVARQANCCVLGVDHFGKNVDSGTRGASEGTSAAVVLAVLGTRDLNGAVTNTRVALRKVRGAPQGEEYWFTVRKVEAPEPDEDGEPVTTLVIDWQHGPPTQPQAEPDPWQDSRQSETRDALALLKRILMTVLASKGAPQPIAPDGPIQQAVALEILRTEFCAQTVADGTPDQQRRYRAQRFRRTLDRAQALGLIGMRQTEVEAYVWLATPQTEDGEDF